MIKNVVLSAVRDYTTDYFHLGSGALPASSNGNGWQQHSPHADGERLAYAAVVRGAFRSAVMQYLRVCFGVLLFVLNIHVSAGAESAWGLAVLLGPWQETATNMSFPEDDVELGGKGGGATLRVDFHRSSSTASSSGTEVSVYIHTVSRNETFGSPAEGPCHFRSRRTRRRCWRSRSWT